MKRLSGFSLMEMMTVLLIVSVVAAASAPMINKRMMVNQGAGNCPWERLADGSIFYNQDAGDRSVIIGANATNNNLSPKLHIRTTDNVPFITFQRDGVNNQLALRYRANTVSLSTNNPANNATVIGANANASTNSIAIGRNAQTAHQNAIVIGDHTGNNNPSMTGNDNTIAIGHFARVFSRNSLVMGNEAFVNGNADNSIAIGNNAFVNTNADNSIAIGNDARVNFSNAQEGANSGIAIGNGARANLEDCIAIGRASFSSFNSIAIGNSASVPGRSEETRMRVVGVNSVGIGNGVQTRGERAVALGFGAQADTPSSIAIGDTAYANSTNSIAIGTGAYAPMENSVAIGNGVSTSYANQIVLGTSSNTVYIPGNLVVGGDTFLGVDGDKRNALWLRTYYNSNCQDQNKGRGAWVAHSGSDYYNSTGQKTGDNDNHGIWPINGDWSWRYDGIMEGKKASNLQTKTSDRRLKNVGKAFTSGLAEIKKLEVFNYTFKKDESKTPRVGVMAQDLQKIFPNAVTKGEDGFLRIRMEDMFYALVNAVKELANMFDKQDERIVQLEKENMELHKTVSELEKQNKEILKRLEKLEKQK